MHVECDVSNAYQSISSIDYDHDRFALAIIKHSPHKPQEQSDQLDKDHTGPAVSSLAPDSWPARDICDVVYCRDSLKSTTSHMSLAGPSSSRLNSPASNSLSRTNPP